MGIVEQLNPIFKPKSIAVIGASSDPMKFGNWVTTTAMQSKFKGPIYLVNPKVPEVNGLKTYANIMDVPGSVDLVSIIVPAPIVPKVLEECGKKGVKGAIIFTSGFKEIGQKGFEREKEVLAVAKKNGIRLVGPNCMGIYSSAVNLNMTILAAGEPGNVGFITQSGGYGIEIFGSAMAQGIHFSKFISTGDKVDLQEYEYLEYLYNDPDTEVIMMYMEGLERGREFFELARKITQKKPIFAIKIGRTSAGGAAARSHTGALAGEDDVYEAAFRQAGIIRAYDVEELFDYVRAYITQPLPKGRHVGMIVGSGGLGCAAVDKCCEVGLQVPPISDENTQALKEILPEFASVKNPIDFTASGAIGLFSNIMLLKNTFADPCVDSWFLGFTGGSISGIDDILETFKPMLDEIDSKIVMEGITVPLVGSMDEHDKLIRPILQKMFGVTLYSTPERAIKALAALNRYREYLDEVNTGEAPPKVKPIDDSCRKIIATALKEGRKSLTEVEAVQVLASYGIPAPETHLAKNTQEAAKFAEKIGYPVVMKIVSPEILHKSDANGVKLNLKSESDVLAAFDSIVDNAKKYNAHAKILGITVQKMGAPGIEVIVGMKKDIQFGPVIVFGLGGILVELLKDVSMRLAPITQTQAEKMIGEIKAHKLLEGYRQYKPVDKKALALILTKISAMVEQNPEIKEMDLNPVFAYSNGAMAVDARIILE
ncbi:MAG: acetate--CoA ligase family protein [Candidatus Thermoplasmatota archaeon]|nr:acetate--CoA ligase family protein [Candidatus Thermoplasmatota archaeon]